MLDNFTDIINQVQSTWPKDIIIRYLYIKLAPYIERDLYYFLADEEEKERQFKQGFINRFPYVVCATLADFYVDLFKQFGINAKKIIARNGNEKSKVPLFALIVEGERGWYFLNPLADLFYNQYELKPSSFGIIPRYETVRNNFKEIIQLPSEYVNELDTELNIKFLDDYFSNLHQIFAIKSKAKLFFGLPNENEIDLKERKIEFYNDKLINLGCVNGAFERAQLYNFLNNKSLNREEKKYTKVKIVGGIENPHISVKLINRNEIISYEEEKNNGKYTLKKIYKTKN